MKKPDLAMQNKYAIFIAPALIALNERVLEFVEQNPDNGFFDEETIQKTKDTITELKQMIEEDNASD